MKMITNETQLVYPEIKRKKNLLVDWVSYFVDSGGGSAAAVSVDPI